jgi:hypothetical protein
MEHAALSFTSISVMTATLLYRSFTAKKGPAPGSIIFDMVFHPIYLKCAAAFPDFVIVAHTDDKPAAVPAPPDGDWDKQLRRLSQCGDLYDTMANKIGVFRNKEKSVLLLPASVPRDTPALSLFPVHTFEGITLMGRPIGTDQFITEGCETKCKRSSRVPP